MSLFLNIKSKNTNCINGCKTFYDDSTFSYWENRKTTSDELKIVNYLLLKKNYIKKKNFTCRGR